MDICIYIYIDKDILRMIMDFLIIILIMAGYFLWMGILFILIMTDNHDDHAKKNVPIFLQLISFNLMIIIIMWKQTPKWLLFSWDFGTIMDDDLRWWFRMITWENWLVLNFAIPNIYKNISLTTIPNAKSSGKMLPTTNQDKVRWIPNMSEKSKSAHCN